jgi:hypothetical protein
VEGETNAPTLSPPPTASHAPTRVVSAAEEAVCSMTDTTNIADLGLTGWECSPSGEQVIAICDGWEGITCLDDEVVEIALDDKGLVGTLPEALANLASLRRLSAHTNQLVGPIPTAYGQMPNLRRLDLHNNLFGSASRRLQELNRRELQTIEGDLALFSILPLLEYLDVSGNGYVGVVPSSLCDLPLQTLILSSLTGTSYTENNFECIASCLVNDPNLVIVRLAALPVCVDIEPTAAPTLAAGGLAGGATPNAGFGTTNIISLVVGLVLFLIIVFLISYFIWKRYRDQKEAQGENAATWKDKEKSRLHLTRLDSVGGGSSVASSGEDSRGRKRNLGDGYEIHSQSSGDLSFPVIVDFDEDEEDDNFDDDDDMTAEYFGARRRDDDSCSIRSSRSSRYSESSASSRSSASGTDTLDTGHGSSSASSSVDASSRFTRSIHSRGRPDESVDDMSSVSHSIYSDNSPSVSSYTNTLSIREGEEGEEESDGAEDVEQEEKKNEPIFVHDDDVFDDQADASPCQASHFSTFADFYRPEGGGSSVGSRSFEKGEESSVERRRREEEARLDAEFTRPIVYRAGSSQSLTEAHDISASSGSILDRFKVGSTEKKKNDVKVKSQKFGL